MATRITENIESAKKTRGFGKDAFAHLIEMIEKGVNNKKEVATILKNIIGPANPEILKALETEKSLTTEQIQILKDIAQNFITELAGQKISEILNNHGDIRESSYIDNNNEATISENGKPTKTIRGTYEDGGYTYVGNASVSFSSYNVPNPDGTIACMGGKGITYTAMQKFSLGSDGYHERTDQDMTTTSIPTTPQQPVVFYASRLFPNGKVLPSEAGMITKNDDGTFTVTRFGITKDSKIGNLSPENITITGVKNYTEKDLPIQYRACYQSIQDGIKAHNDKVNGLTSEKEQDVPQQPGQE